MNDFTKEELLSLLGSLMVCFADDGSDDKLMDKLNSMIENYCEPDVNYGHLNDKHIGQWAGYLIEEFPRWQELENILLNNTEIEKVFLEMYKKGFDDCKTEGGTK